MRACTSGHLSVVCFGAFWLRHVSRAESGALFRREQTGAHGSFARALGMTMLAVLLSLPTSSRAQDSTPQVDLLDRLEPAVQSSRGGWLKALGKSLGLTPRPASQAGRAYAEEEYELAAQRYREALLDEPQSPKLSFNLGNALYHQRKFDEAIQSYTRALGGAEPKLAASSHYNLGNSHFRKGEFAVQAGKQEGIDDYRKALAHYKKSLELQPEDTQAKRNIEVVQARIKELLERQEQEQQQQQQQNPDQEPPPEPSEKAKQALARAMQLVKQQRYEEAQRVLEAIIQEDPTAESYQSHVQRIDDIIRILNGEDPVPPAPQDPRLTQPGLGVI